MNSSEQVDQLIEMVQRLFSLDKRLFLTHQSIAYSISKLRSLYIKII